MENIEKKKFLANFSSRIKSARREANLTQAEAAALAGLSTRGFQEIESGQSDPQFTSLAPLSAALGVSIDELANKPSKSDIFFNIMKILPTLNDSQLRGILSVAEANATALLDKRSRTR